MFIFSTFVDDLYKKILFRFGSFRTLIHVVTETFKYCSKPFDCQIGTTYVNMLRCVHVLFNKIIHKGAFKYSLFNCLIKLAFGHNLTISLKTNFAFILSPINCKAVPRQ